MSEQIFNSALSMLAHQGMEETADITLRHAVIMQKLQTSLEQIWCAIPKGSTIFYLDYPMYLNIGDLLINAGTEHFFKTSRYNVAGRLCFFDLCDWPDVKSPNVILRTRIMSKLLASPRETIFVFQGGGNLGDIYFELNAQRVALVERLSDYRVVILPQSMHFESTELQRDCLQRLLAHPDLHLFLRDEVSLAAAREVSPQAGILCPDMAHALWSSYSPARGLAPSRQKLVVRRRDAESVVASPQTDAMDWDDLISRSDELLFRVIRKIHHARLSGSSPSMSYRDWYLFRNRLIRRAVHYFTAYQDISTDRLHGMILGALLGKSCSYSDNSYGKLSRYHDLWLKESPLLRSDRGS